MRVSAVADHTDAQKPALHVPYARAVISCILYYHVDLAGQTELEALEQALQSLENSLCAGGRERRRS